MLSILDLQLNLLSRIWKTSKKTKLVVSDLTITINFKEFDGVNCFTDMWCQLKVVLLHSELLEPWDEV